MFIKRLYQYQKERFPVLQYVFYIPLFFFAYYITAQAGSSAVFSYTIIGGIIAVFLIFFQLRLSDEIKDYETDSQFMPERPVQRGLISIKEVRIMLVVVTALIFLCSVFHSLRVLFLIGVVELYILLMSMEFFIGHKLKSNRFIYAILHMVVMGLMCLYIIGYTPNGLLNLPVLALCISSFLCGFIIEIGRKIEAPQDEREGVDNYSKLFGARAASFVLLIFCILNSIALNWFFSMHPVSNMFLVYFPLILPSAGAAVFNIKMTHKNSVLLNFSGILYTMTVFIIMILISL